MERPMLAIDRIVMDEENRKYEGTPDLITSVEKLGVFTPVQVTAIPDRPGYYHLVAGHRRVLSAKHYGYASVPYEIVSEEHAEEVRALENMDRKPLQPLDELKAINDLLMKGYSNDEVGQILNMSVYQVERRKRLNNLTDKCSEALYTEKISVPIAAELAIIPKENQDAILKKVKPYWTAKDVRQEYLNNRGKSLSDCSEEFLSMVGDYESPCAKCSFNPMSDALLFPEEMSSEARCTDSVCYCRKIAKIAKEKGLVMVYDGFSDEWLSDGFEAIGAKPVDKVRSWTPGYSKGKPNDGFTDQICGLDTSGNVIYYGGNRIQAEEEKTKSPSMLRFDETKELMEALNDKLKDVLRICQNKIMSQLESNPVSGIPLYMLCHEIDEEAYYSTYITKMLCESKNLGDLISLEYADIVKMDYVKDKRITSLMAARCLDFIALDINEKKQGKGIIWTASYGQETSMKVHPCAEDVPAVLFDDYADWPEWKAYRAAVEATEAKLEEVNEKYREKTDE